MRILLSVFFLGLVLMFASCDDDENIPKIVGIYTLTEESVSGCNDPLENVTEPKTCTASDCTTLTLSGDGTFSEVEIDNGVTTTDSGTYVVNGTQITFTYPGDSDVAEFTLNSGNLVLTYPADGDGCVEADTYGKN